MTTTGAVTQVDICVGSKHARETVSLNELARLIRGGANIWEIATRPEPSPPADVEAIGSTLNFFKSVINSGEAWSLTCQRDFEKAHKALAALRAPPSGERGWRPIETAPIGNEEAGPFFDVMWSGEKHRYLPVPARAIDCYRDQSGTVKMKHGYPSVTTVFNPQPTHWMSLPEQPAAERGTVEREAIARLIHKHFYAEVSGNDDCLDWDDMPERLREYYRVQGADNVLALIGGGV